MILRPSPLCVAFWLASCVAARAQDPPAPSPPPPPIPSTSTAEKPLVDRAGRPIEPGALPQDTSPEARALWERITTASLGPGADRKPIEAFDLELDLRYRQTATQSNDVRSRYRFSVPGWVRLTTERKRELLRGPDGDWLIDPARNEKARLDVGRENAEDRRQLDDTLRIARNFIALTDPRSLRIVSLARLAAPPQLALPKKVRNGAELEWLELRTPDFRAGASSPSLSGAPTGSPPSIARVLLGIDPKTALAALAIVDQDERKAGLCESTVLITLETFKTIDGFQAPTWMRVFEVDDGVRPLAFRAEPTSDIVLIAESARLRPKLAPADFRP